MQGKTYYKRVRAWRGRQLQIVAVSGSLAIIAHGCRLLWPRGSRYYRHHGVEHSLGSGSLTPATGTGWPPGLGTDGRPTPPTVAQTPLTWRTNASPTRRSSQLGEAALSRRALLGSRERVAAPQLLEREPEFLHLDRTELPMV